MRFDELCKKSAPLRVTDHWHRPVAHGIEYGACVSHIRVPAVERRMFGIAVAAMVEGDDPPACLRQERGEYIEGTREVEPPMGEEDRARPLVAPFVDRDADARRVDESTAIGPARAGIGDGLFGDHASS